MLDSEDNFLWLSKKLLNDVDNKNLDEKTDVNMDKINPMREVINC